MISIAAVKAGRYEIYQATTRDEGKTWDIVAVTRKSTADNIRPFVPRSHPKRTTVLWCRGMYESYDHYRTQVVGICVND